MRTREVFHEVVLLVSAYVVFVGAFNGLGCSFWSRSGDGLLFLGLCYHAANYCLDLRLLQYLVAAGPLVGIPLEHLCHEAPDKTGVGAGR